MRHVLNSARRGTARSASFMFRCSANLLDSTQLPTAQAAGVGLLMIMMIYNIVALSQFSRLSTNYHSSHTLLTPKSAYHSLYVFFTYVFSFFSPFFSRRRCCYCCYHRRRRRRRRCRRRRYLHAAANHPSFWHPSSS